MKNFKHGTLAALLALGACAGEDKTSVDYGRVELPNLPPRTVIDSNLPVAPLRDELPGSMCTYWESLAATTDEGSFQILESAAVSGGTVVGRHALKHLPQVRYALSVEGKDASKLEDPYPACPRYVFAQTTPLDPPNIETFMKVAEREKACGRVSGTEYSGLQLLYNTSKISSAAKTELLKTRNSKFKEAVEVQLPGIFTGTSGSLVHSPLMIEFHESAGLSRTPASSNIALYQILSRKVKLFTGSDWDSRRRDFAATLSLLEKYSNVTNLPLNERACRFGLAHRITAQFLSLKGFASAPSLKPDGSPAEIPVEDFTAMPKRDESGIFNFAASEAWIENQVDAPTIRPSGTATTAGLLSALRAFNEMAAHRPDALWRRIDANGDQVNAPIGELRLNPKLLKLGVGLFGVGATWLKNEELTVTPESRIILREDTADNLADLGLAAVEISEGFKSLFNPNWIELQTLRADQIAKFTAGYPDGVVPQFEMLITGFILEGLDRIRDGRDSEKLRTALRTVGDHIGNEMLRNLP